MDKEIDILHAAMRVENTWTQANRTFYTGTIHGVECVFARSGIGKVNAAITASLMLDKKRPDMLINIGVAGGINGMAVGDIALATGIAYFDVNLQGIDDIPYGQMPGSPLVRKTDIALTDKTETILKEANIPYRKGILLSGDMFVTDMNHLSQIMKNVDNPIAVEMEGMAIAEAAAAFDVPFVSLRGISDEIGGSESESYAMNVNDISKKTTKVVLHWLDHIDG